MNNRDGLIVADIILKNRDFPVKFSDSYTDNFIHPNPEIYKRSLIDKNTTYRFKLGTYDKVIDDMGTWIVGENLRSQNNHCSVESIICHEAVEGAEEKVKSLLSTPQLTAPPSPSTQLHHYKLILTPFLEYEGGDLIIGNINTACIKDTAVATVGGESYHHRMRMRFVIFKIDTPFCIKAVTKGAKMMYVYNVVCEENSNNFIPDWFSIKLLASYKERDPAILWCKSNFTGPNILIMGGLLNENLMNLRSLGIKDYKTVAYIPAHFSIVKDLEYIPYDEDDVVFDEPPPKMCNLLDRNLDFFNYQPHAYRVSKKLLVGPGSEENEVELYKNHFPGPINHETNLCYYDEAEESESVTYTRYLLVNPCYTKNIWCVRAD
jgi:hypothetical protein